MTKRLILILLVSFTFFSCNNKPIPLDKNTVLTSWNEGVVKDKIIDFVQRDTNDIPVEDRIAVFDMDGTIACEAPLWFEMYCAVAKLNEELIKDPSLINDKMYQFVKLLNQNPADSFVQNNWASSEGNYIDSIIWKAFEGEYHEDYVNYCTNYLTTAVNRDKKMILGEMFYQPMLELITYLQDNQYQVYIVSGSVQGVIWSIVPEKTTITDRNKLIGTRQILVPVYANNETKFTIKKGIYTPKNNRAGKTDNIYSRIGVQPVFAFGNTTGDFDMLQYAITNKHGGVGFMLNHDDDREYIYPPYHGRPEPNWKQKIEGFGGVVVDIKANFKNVWK